MTEPVLPPAAHPCGSCPYRRDVPSGVWAASEYDKLIDYDRDTPFQPIGVFHCHRQDGRACAGWVATHDMEHSLALRIASADDRLDPDDFLDYETDTPLWPTGAAAAEHGMAGIENPDRAAAVVMAKIAAARRARA